MLGVPTTDTSNIHVLQGTSNIHVLYLNGIDATRKALEICKLLAFIKIQEKLEKLLENRF